MNCCNIPDVQSVSLMSGEPGVFMTDIVLKRRQTQQKSTSSILNSLILIL